MYMRFDVSHVSLFLIVNVSEVVALVNVVVWTRWQAHTTQRALPQAKHPGFWWSSVEGGSAEGMSIFLRERLLLSPRMGGSGTACCIPVLECRCGKSS